MGKNVAVFVDVANIFYAAKAAGVDIDYVTLLKSATAGRDFVRAYAYTGLDPDNENQRNFHSFLARNNYKVVSKDIRKYGDGKVKANLDIELVVDMMKTARNLDIAIVISGDGDFAPAIRAVQEMGVRCEVISFRGNTSSDLIEVADLFTEITQVARVEKGSSRSGRRVADDDEDLSMTEVPDKQSEGTGRGRGRGRGRSKPVDAEPVVAVRGRTRSRVAAVADEGTVAAITSGGLPLTVLPGEKLSRVAAVAPALVASDEEVPEGLEGEPIPAEGDDDEPRRRRRRRGGRGRGRGRGREGVLATEGTLEGAVDADADSDIDVDEDEEEAPAVAAPRPSRLPALAKRVAQTFGSVWDSQIGVPAAATGSAPAGSPPVLDDEDLDEPPIPEYLIAERRRDSRGGPQGGRGGGRGVRGSYSAAVDRERYGGRSSGGAPSGGQGRPSRYAEPAPRGNREPERFRQDRQDRQDRPAPRSAPRGGSPEEPWSEVPPEIEAMLRAQLGSRTAAPRRDAAPAPQMEAAAAPAAEAEVTAEAPRRRTTRKAAPAGTAEVGSESAGATAAPKRRTTRKPAAAVEAPSAAVEAPTAEAAPKRRTTRKPAAATAGTDAEGTSTETAPKRRTTRKVAEPAG
jgi:uncharacterized LabA/DUF88 family protein